VVVGDLDGKIRVGSTVGEDAIVEAGKACVDLGGAGPRERRVGNGRSKPASDVVGESRKGAKVTKAQGIGSRREVGQRSELGSRGQTGASQAQGEADEAGPQRVGAIKFLAGCEGGKDSGIKLMDNIETSRGRHGADDVVEALGDTVAEEEEAGLDGAEHGQAVGGAFERGQQLAKVVRDKSRRADRGAKNIESRITTHVFELAEIDGGLGMRRRLHFGEDGFKRKRRGPDE
jgi:hypothetical protein